MIPPIHAGNWRGGQCEEANLWFSPVSVADKDVDALNEPERRRLRGAAIITGASPASDGGDG